MAQALSLFLRRIFFIVPRFRLLVFFVWFGFLLASGNAWSQAAAKPTPVEPGSPEALAEAVKPHPTGAAEIAAEAKPTKGIEPGFLYFKDGDRVAGTLSKIHKDYLTFNLSRGGEITVQPSDLIEYWSTETYAIFKKGVRIALTTPLVGKINIRGEDIFLTPETGAPIDIEAADIEECLNNDTFLYEMKKARPWNKDWRARVGFGVSINRSTDDGTALNTEISVDRSDPEISFLPERSRVSVLVTDEYEKVTGPAYDYTTGSTTVQGREEHTLHANAEYDHHLHKQLFWLAMYTFDRDYSQLLLAQHSYGAGVGWTVYKNESNELVFKTDLDYRTQDFEDYLQNMRHVGQKISQTLYWYFPHSIQLSESLDADFAYVNARDTTGRASVELHLPVYRSVGLELSASDDYLNDTSRGTDRNSYRFITRITYSF